MRILFVEFTSAVSGAERSLLELVRGLRADHEVMLACPAGPLAGLAVELGVRVFPIPASQLTFRLHPVHTPRGLADMAGAAWQLGRVVRRLRPSVVHANSIRAGLVAIPAARGVSPIVVHCRDMLPRGVAGRVVRTAIRGGADQVVAISWHVATTFADGNSADGRVTVVHNGVDLTRFDPAAISRPASRSALDVDGHFVVSVVAQITPWKGQDLAIRTLAELRRRGVDALLLVVGEAKFVGAATSFDNRAFERELHALVDELHVGEHVRFLGDRSDPERVLAATDALLVPSTEEPFGRTIIEAMAMGVPVAATSVGGPPEILCDGTGGLVVSSRAPESWADVVEELAAWPPERLAASRVVVASRFSRARHTAAMLNVYTTVLARRDNASTRFPARWRRREHSRALRRTAWPSSAASRTRRRRRSG